MRAGTQMEMMGEPSRATGCAVGVMTFSHCQDGVRVWVALLSPGLLCVDPRHVLAHSAHLRELTAKLAVLTTQGLARPWHLSQGTTQKPPPSAGGRMHFKIVSEYRHMEAGTSGQDPVHSRSSPEHHATSAVLVPR